MRRALALIALLPAACADTVVLGTECVTGGGNCEQVRPGPGPDGVDAGAAPSELIDSGDERPSTSLDSGSDEPVPVDPQRDSGARGPRDAAVVPIRDASRPPPVPPDAGPPTYPLFTNPSFELIDGGREGPVAEFNPNVQTPTESPIAPWQICRPGTAVVSSASYGLPGRMTTITPRDGNTFISDTFPIVAFNTNGINQELGEALVPGKRYAFAVDVFAQLDILVNLRDLVLEVMSTDALGCVGRSLDVSEPIPAGSWQTRCIDFIAPDPLPPLSRPVRNLMLMVNAPGDLVNLTAVLHIDNIRPVTPGLCDADAGTP